MFDQRSILDQTSQQLVKWFNLFKSSRKWQGQAELASEYKFTFTILIGIGAISVLTVF